MSFELKRGRVDELTRINTNHFTLNHLQTLVNLFPCFLVNRESFPKAILLIPQQTILMYPMLNPDSPELQTELTHR